jgi:hypothetical protein
MSNASEVQVAISAASARPTAAARPSTSSRRPAAIRSAGRAFTSYAGKWGQSSNIDDHLARWDSASSRRSSRATTPNLAVGGPILRDRVWFYGNTRAIGTYQEQQNLYDNLNAGNPNAWTWATAKALSVRNSTSKTLNAVRLTWQATQKNKFGFYIDYTKNCSAGAYTEGGDQCRAPVKAGSRRDLE